jgi:hypothetical protein
MTASNTTQNNDPTHDHLAWSIILDFANGTISSLVEAENRLRTHLGSRFDFLQWKPAFDEVFKAEDDVSSAIAAVNELREKALTDHVNRQPISISQQRPLLPELNCAESGLMQAVNDLRERKRIRGTQPTLEELLNPLTEKEVGESPYRYPGGDDEIIEEVKQHQFMA